MKIKIIRGKVIVQISLGRVEKFSGLGLLEIAKVIRGRLEKFLNLPIILICSKIMAAIGTERDERGNARVKS